MTGKIAASKRVAPEKGVPPPRPPAKRVASASGPFLRFYLSDTLCMKTLSILTTIELSKDAAAHRAALADVIVELTNNGMDFYFMRPLKLAKAGFVVEQSANIGMSGVKQVMASVIRQIVGRMSSPQLLSVCKSIRQLMR
jgi:hypothetical protein